MLSSKNSKRSPSRRRAPFSSWSLFLLGFCPHWQCSFVFITTKSPGLLCSAQVWAVSLFSPFAGLRLEFTKNNPTENQQNEQRKHKQLKNRFADLVQVPNLKTTEVLPPPPPTAAHSHPPQKRSSQVKLFLMLSLPPASPGPSAQQKWIRERAGGVQSTANS